MRFEDLPNVPDHFYRHHLPHFDPKDAPYTVMYRLSGSIPTSEIGRLRLIAQRGQAAHRDSLVCGEAPASPPILRGDAPASPHTGHGEELFFHAMEEVLHCNGPYHLGQPEIRDLVIRSLQYLDGRDLQLYAYSIMPNHVHAVFDLVSGRKLYRVMQSHKTWTARRANILLGRTGWPFWKPETYDHIIREGHLGAAIWYTLLNPVKAGLVENWEDWPGNYLAPGIYGFCKDPRAEFSR